MRLGRVKISEFMGIEELEFSPGRGITLISGDNGTGKTSIIEAVKAGLQGGQDATLMRGGFPAEVVLILEDDCDSYSITKPIRDTKPEPVLRKNGEIQKRPAEFLKRLFVDRSLNPVSFLMAPKKDRARWLLDAMPLSVSLEQIQSALGCDTKYDVSGHAMEVIGRFDKTLREERTGTNRLVKEKEAHASELSAALPPGEAVDCKAELAAVTSDIEKTNQSIRLTQGKAEAVKASLREDSATAKQATIVDVTAQAHALRQQIRDKAAADIAAIEEVLATEVGLIKDSFAGDLAGEILNIDDQTAKAVADLDSNKLALSIRKQELESLAAEQVRTQGIRTALDATVKSLQNLYAEQDHLNTSLQNLAGLRDTLCAKLPVPGVMVSGDEVTVDGVIWERVNRARKIDVSIDVALLAAGELKLLCLDDMECLSPKTMAQVAERINAKGVQAIMTRVSSDPELMISSLSEEEVDTIN